MHHPELAGESASSRKMAQAANCPRRTTASTAVGSSVLTSSSGGANLGTNMVPSDEYKPSALIQTLPTAASSLGSQQPPPHTLNIHSQSSILPPGMASSGAQIKKKSGFQITSVTPAQISVSTNNSITEDTESCDDLDESHTEDLSSSEILDVSLSRANDAAGPERSSSEDTLNNLHDAETPGAVSPNQPPLLPQTHSAMVNGAVHHHHHTHHHHQLHSTPSGSTLSASSVSGGTQAGIPLGNVVMSTVTPNPGALPIIDQKMPSNVGGMVDNSTVGTISVGQPLIAAAPGISAGINSAVSDATVSVKPIASNVNNLNSCVPGLGGISTNSVAPSAGLNNTNNQNVNLMRQQSSSINSAMTIPTGTTASAVIGSSSGSHVGITDIIQPSAAAAPASNIQPQQTQMPVPHTTSSRFRVVKLDSTSEPFKKGRWTCTDYYDKEGLISGSSENVPSTRTAESIRQFLPDISERETVTVSSVSSSVSTLSHYSEGVVSGDVGGSSAVQQSFPPGHMSEYSMPANVSKPQMHPHKKANTATPVPVSNQQQAPVNMGGLQTTTGHPSPAVPPQQLTYAQAAQLTPAQNVPGVTQQQMAYPPAPQATAAAQVAPVLVTSLSQGGSRPSDFAQSQQLIQVAASGSTQALPHLSTSMTPVSITGNGQVMPPSQPPVGNIPAAVAQSVTQGILQPQQTPQMVQAPTGGVITQLVQSTGPGVVQQLPKGPQLPTQLSVEQQTPLSSQGIGAQFVPVTSSLPTSNVPLSIQSDPQAGLVQNGAKDGGAQPAVNALYATLPTLMATHLEDAQRLLIQHQSLLTFPKLAVGEGASQTGTSLAPEESGGVSALTASASLLKNLPVDGEEDGYSRSAQESQ
ncbi:TSC22 domain family protein 1 isoform X2 [Tachysurus vachellii]|uniref:TSC22 domain family protein 1 isoform X2 n=1 Tax=Tachysurus vachellii TaxID=175792 RepID=UPI00296AAA97|nr:TSC22 domain family protein 1 isoform X2 [Tachysurus vachellii]